MTFRFISYLHRTVSCLFIFLLNRKSFCGALRSFVRTVTPSNFFLNRFLFRRFDFTSFNKLGNFLSLNLAKWELLTIFSVRVCVAYVVFFGTFCVARASLTPTTNTLLLLLLSFTTIVCGSTRWSQGGTLIVI